jgi:hypothetical protein
MFVLVSNNHYINLTLISVKNNELCFHSFLWDTSSDILKLWGIYLTIHTIIMYSIFFVTQSSGMSTQLCNLVHCMCLRHLSMELKTEIEIISHSLKLVKSVVNSKLKLKLTVMPSCFLHILRVHWYAGFVIVLLF